MDIRNQLPHAVNPSGKNDPAQQASPFLSNCYVSSHGVTAEAKKLVYKLESDGSLDRDEFIRLISAQCSELNEYVSEKARILRHRNYGTRVYIRGLIEFTSYCRNDCYYCGIRKSNASASRYRLTEEQIMQACETGHKLGFRTFVLQGGEDPYFSDNRIIDIIKNIKNKYPDCALTLSIGEKSRDSYLAYFSAGADRYLLRHETANPAHYAMLHPSELSIENRKRCLWDLRKIGYQVGTGFMVGSPFQTAECLADDMIFLSLLKPEMVGIGPFIPHHDTPFAGHLSGTAGLTLFMISLIRIMLPNALIPATTALGTVDGHGRELGILAGANVVMPNLSPVDVRAKYLLYDNKICTGDGAAECRFCMERRMRNIGYEVVVSRGDFAPAGKIIIQHPEGSDRQGGI
jgi:biotin synthase